MCQSTNNRSSFLLLTIAVPALLTGSSAIGRQPESKTVRAQVVAAKRAQVDRAVTLPATLRADEVVEVFAKTSGYVREVHVDIGDKVSRGDALVQIHVPEMGDELRQAEAIHKARESNVKALRAKSRQAQRMIDTARAEVSRYEAQQNLDVINYQRRLKLHQQNAIPKQQLDEAQNALAIADAMLDIAKAKVDGAQAEFEAVMADVAVAQSEVSIAASRVALLKTMMGYATLMAPFDGIVTRRNIDTGAFVRSASDGASMPLLRIEKMDRLRWVLEVPEVDVPFVRPGTIVSLVVRAAGEKPLTARVSRTAGSVSPETRTMRVEADVENTSGLLVPGMYARATVQLESKQQALVVPSEAIRNLSGVTSVLVVSGGVARAMPVVVGHDDGIMAEVISGLEGGERVITAASGVVNAGETVQVIETDS